MLFRCPNRKMIVRNVQTIVFFAFVAIATCDGRVVAQSNLSGSVDSNGRSDFAGSGFESSNVTVGSPDAFAAGAMSPETYPGVDPSLAWWQADVRGPMLDRPRWIAFDLPTLLLDALDHSPRIASVSRRTSVTLERIVQQDAAFDPSMLLESRLGRTNDPVGNTLTTGGPSRLIDDSFSVRGGVQKTGRRGTVMDVTQELGTLTSNSLFFTPVDQGNSRLGLSLTQPLLARGGQVYNERLLTQARIDGRISWQEMRGEVEQQIADVVTAYWQLYELRCHLRQAMTLLDQARAIESILIARQAFDTGNIELAKARGRVARRHDRTIQLKADIFRQQIQLARLVGSDELIQATASLEFIPEVTIELPDVAIDLRQAVLQGVQNRPEVRSAAMAMEAAALSIQVTRTELLPEINAVFDGYLAGLNGDNDFLRSFGDQFSRGGPGLAGGLLYEMPYARRAAKSRHREANFRYQQRSEELRESIQQTHAQIEVAVVNVNTAITQQRTKQQIMVTATEEELILTRRWETMASDGGNVGLVLENLLDSQQRRTEAEREWTTARSTYLTALVELQRAMGTLLTHEDISPVSSVGDNSVQFIHQGGVGQATSSQSRWTEELTSPAFNDAMTDQSAIEYRMIDEQEFQP